LRATGAPDTAHPDGGVRPDDDEGHALRRLLPWLDHVAGLGCGGLLLTPIASSSTHGYDTIDPFVVDPRLGDDADFDALVVACRERDLRLLLDGVLNHVGRAFPRFADVVADGRSSPSVDWFRLDFERDDGDGFAYRTFEGHRDLVALNHRSAEVLDWAVRVCNHWLDRGADGWRLDVAYAIPRPFLADLARLVRERHPDAFVFGEMIHGDYAGFVAESGLDSVTQYELHKALWSSCNDANAFELAWALQRHAQMCERFVPVTFAGNHDVTRIGTRLDDPRRDVGTVLTAVWTVPGTPCLYYGDEWGARGTKRDGPGGDDEIRPRLDDLVRDDEVEALHRRLVAFRKERPWLTDASLVVGGVENRRLSYAVRGEGGAAVHVALGFGGEAVDGGPSGGGWQPVEGLPGVWELPSPA
jgi:cyclomaltodextrinase